MAREIEVEMEMEMKSEVGKGRKGMEAAMADEGKCRSHHERKWISSICCRSSQQFTDCRDIAAGSEEKAAETSGFDEIRGECRSCTMVRKLSQLVDYEALPDYLQDNEYIVGHYRADWPLREAFLSIFSLHNETVNIWTHLIGFFLFLGLTVYTVTKIAQCGAIAESKFKVSLPFFKSKYSESHEIEFNQSRADVFYPHQDNFTDAFTANSCRCISITASSGNLDDRCVLVNMNLDIAITRWPFFIFLCGAMFCLLSSTACHLLSCHSRRLSYFLWRLDYAGISAMITTSFFPPVYYTFLCDKMWREFYLTGISLIGLTTVLVTLIPVFQASNYRRFRAFLFLGMGLSGIIPGLHALFAHWNEPACITTLVYETAMAFFYGLGTLFYATRVPERWKPGWFDLAGHSHQIFHVLVIAGAYTHYKAGLMYLEWRDSKGCEV
ncbi:hypothetical protein O6H91_17G036600 [Diphasiastrum complanatum]|uniref:Uncharacterized protein n=1 Tax=Diphasiastrum complanatum TaxID=34168 RepID=A0ACC2B5P9_DIPCM|nr:hypothetical protein O6H91_17G036600 [Diphasiastrum complanatum]